MQTPFKPAKSLWTESDFEVMSWHDNRLHGIGIVDDFEPHEHEVRFDIDYIFQWSGHGDDTGPEGFWIAPSTLVFPTSRLSVEGDGSIGSWIMAIERHPSSESKDDRAEFTWEISLDTGNVIVVQSRTYAQYTRRTPVFVAGGRQNLETSERGAISFDKRLYDA